MGIPLGYIHICVCVCGVYIYFANDSLMIKDLITIDNTQSQKNT